MATQRCPVLIAASAACPIPPFRAAGAAHHCRRHGHAPKHAEGEPGGCGHEGAAGALHPWRWQGKAWVGGLPSGRVPLILHASRRRQPRHLPVSAACAAGPTLRPSSPRPQELIKGLTQLFDELDVNASGSVSMDELVSGLDRLGYDIRMDGERRWPRRGWGRGHRAGARLTVCAAASHPMSAEGRQTGRHVAGQPCPSPLPPSPTPTPTPPPHPPPHHHPRIHSSTTSPLPRPGQRWST